MLTAQEKLIGSLFWKQDCIPDVAQRLDTECLSAELQPVYNAVIGYYETRKGDDIDLDLFAQQHKEEAAMFGICAEGVMNEAINPTKERMFEWADLITKEAAVRDAQLMAAKAFDNGTTYEDTVDIVQKLYERMTRSQTVDNGFTAQKDLFNGYIRQKDEKPVVIESGIQKLDRYLMMKPGNLIIIGGRPSAGKTALALQISVNMAKAGKKVCFFSLETNPEALERRIISHVAQIPMLKVSTNEADPLLLDRMASVQGIPLYIKSASGFDVAHVRRDAVREKADVVIVDYLQLLKADGKDRFTQITNVSIALHEMAQQTGALVIVLSQLNRLAARMSPSNADLRESGQIEQDADGIILLAWKNEETRDGYYFYLSKNKEGGVGTMDITFDPTYQTFREVYQQ